MKSKRRSSRCSLSCVGVCSSWRKARFKRSLSRRQRTATAAHFCRQIRLRTYLQNSAANQQRRHSFPDAARRIWKTLPRSIRSWRLNWKRSRHARVRQQFWTVRNRIARSNAVVRDAGAPCWIARRGSCRHTGAGRNASPDAFRMKPFVWEFRPSRTGAFDQNAEML